MILDTDIIPFTTNSYRVYKSEEEYFMINGEDSFLIEQNGHPSKARPTGSTHLRKPQMTCPQLDRSCSEEEFEQFQDDYDRLEERFDIYYRENQASCHHFIGEFRIDSENYAPFVGSFYGFDYFSEREIEDALSKLIRCIEMQSGKGLKEYEIKVATLYDLESLDNIEPNKYQLHEYSLM
jgi:hypothetical protein